MIVPRLIERKRDGGRLEAGEIREFVLAYAKGQIPDYQVAAFLMAVYFRGLDRNEMNAMMEAMLESGKRLDLSRLPRGHLQLIQLGSKEGEMAAMTVAPRGEGEGEGEGTRTGINRREQRVRRAQHALRRRTRTPAV